MQEKVEFDNSNIWGKKDKTEGHTRPLLYHMIDVASVVEAMWDSVFHHDAQKHFMMALGLCGGIKTSELYYYCTAPSKNLLSTDKLILHIIQDPETEPEGEDPHWEIALYKDLNDTSHFAVIKAAPLSFKGGVFFSNMTIYCA
jgi:hypothetical protein